MMRLSSALRGSIRQRAPKCAYNPLQTQPWASCKPALSRTLSSSAIRYSNGKQSAQQPKESNTEAPGKTASSGGNGNPELPKFSLDGLGLGRNMKIFLVAVLCVFGTMETWFYCKAIWQWWKGKSEIAVEK